MGLREQSEAREAKWLSARAALASQSRGRDRKEPPCPVRTEFQRDRDRIIHCKAFRRLKHKTQVFIAPEGDHFRTRLTHTLEVAQIARTIARALRLNEDLTEAIALGHDLGHTPFGHAGEAALNEVFSPGFRHNEQSLRVVDVLENLNLTWEVRDGILCHTGERRPHTLEGQIVRLADRIAYINHDIDDAIRGRVLTLEDLPRDCMEVLGWSHAARINRMVTDVIDQGCEGDIHMSSCLWEATDKLRDFLFDKVYIGSAAKAEENKAQDLVQRLYRYYSTNPEEIPVNPGEAEVSDDRLAVDYIAGMTDTYAVNRFMSLFVPGPFRLGV